MCQNFHEKIIGLRIKMKTFVLHLILDFLLVNLRHLTIQRSNPKMSLYFYGQRNIYVYNNAVSINSCPACLSIDCSMLSEQSESITNTKEA